MSEIILTNQIALFVFFLPGRWEVVGKEQKEQRTTCEARPSLKAFSLSYSGFCCCVTLVSTCSYRDRFFKKVTGGKFKSTMGYARLNVKIGGM